jgi:transposase
VELIAELRRLHFVEKVKISELARRFKLSRPTVRKHLQTAGDPVYPSRKKQPYPQLGPDLDRLKDWLEFDTSLPKKRRHTAQRLFERLQVEGYRGGYSSIQRFVKAWKKARTETPKGTQAFVPLAFPPGETCQFDWSHETVVLGGVEQVVKVAHFRLSYSRRMFVVAYPRESQEMVLDAHVQAFACCGGVPKRMVYDNLTPVVEAVVVGKERRFNRRFMTLASHYLFEPVACTPASGWEKGQVENQVGNVREWWFTPTPRFDNLAALNAWLTQRCAELAQRPHPTQAARTIAECFAEEQGHLIPVTAAFDGHVDDLRRVSSQCLVSADRNRYSVPAKWANQVVSVRLSADRVRVVANDAIVAEHPRCFGRDQLLRDPWHYLPVIEHKPGALRHGAPFVQWDLPVPINVVRDRLLKQERGDRAFVDLLLMARELGDRGLETLEVACDLTLQSGVICAAVVVNAMQRLTEASRPQKLPSACASIPQLTLEPIADCSRYDSLRGVPHVH